MALVAHSKLLLANEKRAWQASICFLMFTTMENVTKLSTGAFSFFLLGGKGVSLPVAPTKIALFPSFLFNYNTAECLL